MSSTRARTPGSRWARCTRWPGLDRNPLRRPADRIEAVLRFAVLTLLLTAVPIATTVVGHAVDRLELSRLHAQQAADHLVGAVLTQKAVSTGAPDPYSSVPKVWVDARWTAPDGSVHAGQVLAPVGVRKGGTVPTWVSASGAATDPPQTHRVVLIDVFIAVMSTGLLLVLSLIGFQLLACYGLDRRRISTWDAEWRVIGPRWTGHRG